MKNPKVTDFRRVTLAPRNRPNSEVTKLSAYITVLTSPIFLMTKNFYIEGKELKVKAYPLAKHFSAKEYLVIDLKSLMTLVRSIKRNQCIIRGRAGKELRYTVRRQEIFPESKEGSHWVMLDIDGMRLPEGMDPLSPAAIAYIVSKLPKPFREASHGYQLSASAGILTPDGLPRKPGISVHLFFWLDRPVPGKLLGAYLKQHCLAIRLYEFEEGSLHLKYGLDMSTVVNPIQPHFIASPIVEEGVQCILAAEDRIGLVKGQHDSVQMPDIPSDLIQIVEAEHNRIVAERARSLGRRTKVQQTRTREGTSLQRFYDLPDAINGQVVLGKALESVILQDDKKSVILHFVGEKTKGSWFVSIRNPATACRFGDLARVPLKELSPDAHAYVRDTLKWFSEIRTDYLKLDANGYLPLFSDFIKTRVSILIAPTASGKTRQFIGWAKNDVDETDLIIYVAPLIVLLDQMQGDLEADGITFHRYDEDDGGDLALPKVLLTTTHSLPKMLGKASRMGRRLVFVFDEIHMTLEVITKDRQKQDAFESAICRSNSVIFMTGTMTDLQAKTLSDVCHHAIPGLGSKDFSNYIFPPVKEHILKLVESAYFGQDVIGLMREMQALRLARKPLPRTVLILDSSKLESYRLMLEQYGLIDVADIVSRRESDDEEIKAAVRSNKAILVTTLLFGVGLNFDHLPKRLWCCLNMVDADTNSINQTINRANRSGVSCEVRLYYTPTEKKRLVIAPDVVRHQVEAALLEEGSAPGILEAYWHIDRIKYQALRVYEKNTSLAIKALIDSDGFQNYKFQIVTPEKYDKKMDEEYKDLKRQGKIIYEQKVLDYCNDVSSDIVGREYFDHLAAIERREKKKKLAPEEVEEAEECKDAPKKLTQGEAEERKHALLMKLCDLEKPSHARAVDANKLAVMFCDTAPWVSEQYNNTAYNLAANQVKAEKLVSVIAVLEFLDFLKAGEVDPGKLAEKLTRGNALMQGFLALECDNLSYTALHRKFEVLEESRSLARNRSDGFRKEVQKDARKLLSDLLAPLGVRFATKTGPHGKPVTDYSRPLVPATFDCAAMILQLKAMAERYKALRSAIGVLTLEMHEFGDMRSLQVCKHCVFRDRGFCMRQHQIDFWMEDGPHTVYACDDFAPITKRHPALIATNMSDFVATLPAETQQ